MSYFSKCIHIHTCIYIPTHTVHTFQMILFGSILLVSCYRLMHQWESFTMDFLSHIFKQCIFCLFLLLPDKIRGILGCLPVFV